MTDSLPDRPNGDTGAPSDDTPGTTPKPKEASGADALVKIEDAGNLEQARALPAAPGPQPTWLSKHRFGIAYVSVVIVVIVGLGLVGQRVGGALVSAAYKAAAKAREQHRNDARLAPTVDRELQSEAEELLKRLVSRDPAAADLILSRSENWVGKTQRTRNTDQWIGTALNMPDRAVREAAIDAQLALDGVSRDETGLDMVKQAVSNPNQRAWALWMLGALGGRGVDPVHTAKIIETYLDSPDVHIRAVAVDSLALVATDETVPMLLDRFHNDPSPVVQDRAACDLAEAGMYTHEQRMRAAATLVGWLEDPLLTPQQRTWTLQALHDITGVALGSDPAAWRQWWNEHAQD